MYVSTLHTDDDAGWQQYELDDPTWDQVAAAIKALDSARKTLVMLAADEDHWLGIGGGDADGHYFVTITDDSISTYYLAITPDAPDAEIRLVVGGAGGRLSSTAVCGPGNSASRGADLLRRRIARPIGRVGRDLSNRLRRCDHLPPTAEGAILRVVSAIHRGVAQLVSAHALGA